MIRYCYSSLFGLMLVLFVASFLASKIPTISLNNINDLFHPFSHNFLLNWRNKDSNKTNYKEYLSIFLF